jgi:ankyrin repeat protein
MAIIDARDNRGRTPLHEAARHGYLKTVDMLLDCGADVKAKDDQGRTPLHLATLWNRRNTVSQTLIRAGTDFLARDSHGETPLHYAAIHDRGLTKQTTLHPSAPKHQIREKWWETIVPEPERSTALPALRRPRRRVIPLALDKTSPPSQEASSSQSETGLHSVGIVEVKESSDSAKETQL